MPNKPYEKSALFIEDHLSIIDKTGTEVDFTLNAMQRQFVADATGKDIILKGRQMGFSSFILGAFTKDFLFKDNSLSVVLADIASNSEDLLARVKHYIRSYEEKNKTKGEHNYANYLHAGNVYITAFLP